MNELKHKYNEVIQQPMDKSAMDSKSKELSVYKAKLLEQSMAQLSRPQSTVQQPAKPPSAPQPPKPSTIQLPANPPSAFQQQPSKPSQSSSSETSKIKK